MALDLLQLALTWAEPAGRILGGPAVGALIGWFLGRKQRHSAEDDASAAQTNAITHRFETLMDGYESQIDGLVDEIKRLRAQIKDSEE